MKRIETTQLAEGSSSGDPRDERHEDRVAELFTKDYAKLVKCSAGLSCRLDLSGVTAAAFWLCRAAADSEAWTPRRRYTKSVSTSVIQPKAGAESATLDTKSTRAPRS